MTDIIGLVSRLIVNDFNPLAFKKGPALMMVLINLSAVIVLGVGYVIGCKVLYHHFLPNYGETMALLAICGVLVVTSMLLFIAAWFLKPKPASAMNFISEIENTVRDLSGKVSDISGKDIMKKAASLATPKAVVTVFALAILASYFSHSRKDA
ncbi:MAG: hypothetical protein K2Y18_05800 [Alphaproteobacteria bacterium]|jgi:hypothetical protein|nr:hypothetical protein [Alphaproteobacteria bacterium]